MKIEINPTNDEVFRLVEDIDPVIEEHSFNELHEISEQITEHIEVEHVNAAKPAPIENNAGSSWFAGISWG